MYHRAAFAAARDQMSGGGIVKDLYLVGEGAQKHVLADWPREDLEALACAIFDACGEQTTESYPIGDDIKEEAFSIILDCGEEAAMAFAREVLADLEKH
jgi:hypothetical protein